MNVKYFLIITLLFSLVGCYSEKGDANKSSYTLNDLLGSWDCKFQSQDDSGGVAKTELLVRSDHSYVMKTKVHFYEDGGMSVDYTDTGTIAVDGNKVVLNLKEQIFSKVDQNNPEKRKLIDSLTYSNGDVFHIESFSPKSLIFSKTEKEGYPYPRLLCDLK